MLIICFSYFYRYFVKQANNHINIHKRILGMPLIGNFLLNSEVERFSSTMSLLLESGTNLDAALDESSKIFTNKFLSKSIAKTRQDVVEGKDFIFSLKKTNIFPDIFIQLVSSGYKSGNLVKMFAKVSEFMKKEIES